MSRQGEDDGRGLCCMRVPKSRQWALKTRMGNDSITVWKTGVFCEHQVSISCLPSRTPSPVCVCLPVSVCLCLSVCLCVCLPVCLSACLSVCLSACLSVIICLSVRLSSSPRLSGRLASAAFDCVLQLGRRGVRSDWLHRVGSAPAAAAGGTSHRLPQRRPHHQRSVGQRRVHWTYLMKLRVPRGVCFGYSLRGTVR